MKIRHVSLEDAEQVCHLILRVENDSKYMLFGPGERMVTKEQLHSRILAMESEQRSTIIVAESDDKLVGYLMASGGSSNRTNHTVYLVVGILTDYQGQGIGIALFEFLEQWAKQQNIHRMELTVAHPNEAGIRLYKKMKFTIEGTKRNSLYIDGNYVDEYYMAKLI
ncbi:GNAT family N-acetyltransferase [Sporosarcina gallistercoris]|uniref:GNAT family N-acetyltransferase n=1 Tax=Sporosarcina gallistercoris TaxID=2762245 RepID=A0ABR8PMU9_9BACL|nr:GNAT family N-acetyltransferase [Sporosarcina gallistercoris]MBD7909495.1 GNAT family N-acetyltransferase [Sporosarcina gallistercoris]